MAHSDVTKKALADSLKKLLRQRGIEKITVEEICAESMPEFKEVEKGHFVACHRLAEING